MFECVSANKALKIIFNVKLNTFQKTEMVSLSKAVGKVSAEHVLSVENIPPYDRSSVDGYALKASDTFGSSEALPSILKCMGEIEMGERAERILDDYMCFKIPTGGKLPENADSVVMIEYTDYTDDGFCCVLKPVAPFENVIKAGDDIKIGQTALYKNTLIEAKNIGALAALGISELKVKKRFTVGVISTGDELVEVNEKPKGSQIRDINSTLLYAALKNSYIEVKTYPIVKDNKNQLKETALKALNENDMLLISGGSSVGEKDVVYNVLCELGEVLFHGVSIKPGKPTMFAVAESKPVFGLPGHPLAAFFTTRLFVLPLIDKMLGIEKTEKSIIRKAVSNIPSNHGREEILPVILLKDEENEFFEPLFSKSSIISVLNKADGYIRIDKNSEGIKKGEKVRVQLL